MKFGGRGWVQCVGVCVVHRAAEQWHGTKCLTELTALGTTASGSAASTCWYLAFLAGRWDVGSGEDLHSTGH